MFLEQIRDSAEQLLAALETREQRAIVEAQQNFSRSVEEAWRAYQQGKINISGSQALPRTMYLYTTQELPQDVIHLRRWPTIAREIKNFIRMIDIIIPRRPDPS